MLPRALSIVALVLCVSAASLITVLLSPSSSAMPAATRPAPILIAHRGASGYRPEHTLAAYELAIAQGTDFIEPDLVLTKDRVAVARHEPTLATVNPDTGKVIEATTDVASRPEFADRLITRELDGKPVRGWWASDFTLAELRKLRAVERLPDLRPASAAHDGRYEVPTFEEVVRLARRASTEVGRTIGVYPETKHPAFHASIFPADTGSGPDVPHFPLEDAVLSVLRANYPDDPGAPVFIQSFEVANLRYLRGRTRLRLTQLVTATGRPYDFVLARDPRTYADLITPDGLRFVRTYADGLGPEKSLILPRRADGTLSRTPTSLVGDAHAAGLVVHPWTFRVENRYLPADLRTGSTPEGHGDLDAELRAFLDTGIDGLFSDFPDLAAARMRAR